MQKEVELTKSSSVNDLLTELVSEKPHSSRRPRKTKSKTPQIFDDGPVEETKVEQMTEAEIFEQVMSG